MELFTKKKSRFIWCDFTVRGVRYRESTKETNKTRAGIVAARRMAEIEEQGDVLKVRKPKTLEAFSGDFLLWVDGSRLDDDTKRYYRNGWRMVQETKIAKMRLDHITEGHIEALRFSGGPSNTNCALRTLRRMLNRARQAKLLRELPLITLLEEKGRSLLLDENAELALLAHAEQPLSDIIKLMRDTGMRNQRELYCLRIEDLDFTRRVIRVADSKTKAGERMIPMTDRAFEILSTRRAGRDSGYVFPSVRKNKHITGGLVNKQWVRARRAAGLPEDLVLYCGRHDFGTYVYNATGNLKATMMVMGQTDVKTAMRYQHPGLEIVTRAMQEREKESRHTSRHTGETLKLVSG